MSAHKAQGSEFDEVWLVFVRARQRVLSRDGLYRHDPRLQSAAGVPFEGSQSRSHIIQINMLHRISSENVNSLRNSNVNAIVTSTLVFLRERA
jgi:hypothetical protein